MSKPARRLEDRIHELCARAVAARNTEDLNPILDELRLAIHEYVERLRIRLAAIMDGQPEFPPERRKSA